MKQKINKYLVFKLIILFIFTQCTNSNDSKYLYFSNYTPYEEYAKQATFWLPHFLPVGASDIYYFYYYDKKQVFWFYGKYKYLNQVINLNNDYFDIINENKIIDVITFRKKNRKPNWFIPLNNISNKVYYRYKDIYFIVDSNKQIVYFF
jgi:hypothetical protein